MSLSERIHMRALFLLAGCHVEANLHGGSNKLGPAGGADKAAKNTDKELV